MGLFSSALPTHFPIAKGRTLDGDDVRLPHDLPADATLVIVSFQDHLDPLSDQWARLGDRIGAALDGRMAVVESPVVGRAFKMLGDLGTMGIRGQVETEAEHARTIPLYVDTKVFRKALQVKSKDVTAFLLARDGRIAWRGDGAIDMEEIVGLEAAVAEVLAAPIPLATDHPDVTAEEDGGPGTEDGTPDAGAGTTDDEAGTTDDGPRTTADTDAAADPDSVRLDAEAPQPDAEADQPGTEADERARPDADAGATAP